MGKVCLPHTNCIQDTEGFNILFFSFVATFTVMTISAYCMFLDMF